MYLLETKSFIDTLVLRLLLGSVLMKVFTTITGNAVSFCTQLEKNNANDIP